MPSPNQFVFAGAAGAGADFVTVLLSSSARAAVERSSADTTAIARVFTCGSFVCRRDPRWRRWCAKNSLRVHPPPAVHRRAMPATTHYRTCNLCEAMCGLELKVEDGRVTSVRGDAADVFSKGHICPKGPAIAEVWADPDRLRKPMRRTANGFVEVSWEDALDEAAQRLLAVRARHGRNALATYVGNPVVHNHGALVMLQGFLRAVGTKNRFDANSLDTNPKLLAALQMFGGGFSVLVPDVDRTDYMLMIGANPAASNGSLMSL